MKKECWRVKEACWGMEEEQWGGRRSGAGLSILNGEGSRNGRGNEEWQG